jgi:hypothetical protein
MHRVTLLASLCGIAAVICITLVGYSQDEGNNNCCQPAPSTCTGDPNQCQESGSPVFKYVDSNYTPERCSSDITFPNGDCFTDDSGTQVCADILKFDSAEDCEGDGTGTPDVVTVYACNSQCD